MLRRHAETVVHSHHRNAQRGVLCVYEVAREHSM